VIGNTIFVRGIAAALIVLVHVNLVLRPDLDQWWPGGYWFVPLFAIPVPLFFLLAGYATRYGAEPRHTLWHRLRRLVPPLLVWNTGIVFLYGGVRVGSGEWILFLLTGYWYLYFLFVLIQLYALQHFLARFGWVPEPRHLFLATAVMALVFFAIAELMLWSQGASAEFFESVLNRTIFPWALFYCGGMLLRQDPKWLRAIARRRTVLAVLTVAGYLLFVVELRAEDARFGYNPLQQFLMSGLIFKTCAILLLLSVLARRSESPDTSTHGRLLVAFGKEAYGIYLAHVPVLLLVLGLYDRAGVQIPFSLEPPVLWLIAVFGAWGLVKIVRRLPGGWPGWLLFGIRGGNRG